MGLKLNGWNDFTCFKGIAHFCGGTKLIWSWTFVEPSNFYARWRTLIPAGTEASIPQLAGDVDQLFMSGLSKKKLPQ
jgi:hypothetical protein